jgi:hypothetical protein
MENEMEIMGINQEIAKEIADYLQGGKHWIIVAEIAPETSKFIGDIGESCFGNRDFPCYRATYDAMPIVIATFPKSTVSEKSLREGLFSLIGSAAQTAGAGGDIIYLVRLEDTEELSKAFQTVVKLGMHRPGRN